MTLPFSVGVRRLALLLPLALIPVACGGGGGGGGGGPAQVVFPTDGATTASNATTVRGMTTGLTDVTAVMVNGVSATTSDFFENWTATVPLQNGQNTFEVEIFTPGGVITRSGLGSIRKLEGILTNIRGFAIHPTMPIVAIADTDSGRVIEVDMDTGEQTLITPETVTQDPRGIAYDETGSLLYISDIVLDAIFEVNRQTGFVRTVTSNTSNTATPLLENATDLYADSANNRLIVSDFTRDAILAVSLSNGNRSYISNAGRRGGGPSISSPRGIARLDANTALVADRGANDGLIRVDISSGNRTQVTGMSVGSGVDVGSPNDVVISSNGLSAFYIDSNDARVVQVNLINGDRSVLTGEGFGSGPELSSLFAIDIDPQTGRLLINDNNLDALIDVDPVLGTREQVYRGDVGMGPALERPQYSVVDSPRNRILVSDPIANRIFEVSTLTGDRQVFAGEGVDSSSPFAIPSRMAIDSMRNRVIVNYGVGELFEIPLAGGQPMPFSLNDGSSGPTITDPVGGMVVSPDGSTLWLADSEKLLEIDLVTGLRVQRTQDNTFTRVQGLAIDFDAQLAYVLDQSNQAIYLLNLAVPGFLNPTRIADNNNFGSGESFDFPTDLLLQPGGMGLWFQNSNRSRLVSLDLQTGVRIVVSGRDPQNESAGVAAFVGSGPVMQSTSGLAAMPDGSILITDLGVRGVFRVDPESGGRVYLSH